MSWWGRLVCRSLDKLCANRPTRRIDSDGKDYLYRVYLWHFGGFRFYLHKFVGADGDRWLHDHPFHGLSLILAGGYREAALKAFDYPNLKVRERRRRFINFVPGWKFHRITEIETPTWTLFMHTPHHKGWGFLSRQWSRDHQVDPIPHIYHNPYPQNDSHGTHWWKSAKTMAELTVEDGCD